LHCLFLNRFQVDEEELITNKKSCDFSDEEKEGRTNTAYSIQDDYSSSDKDNEQPPKRRMSVIAQSSIQQSDDEKTPYRSREVST
jgi:hypothetical protein